MAKNKPAPTKAKPAFPSFTPPLEPPRTPPNAPDVPPEEPTQFIRAVCLAYRNAMAAEVAIALHEVVFNWLTPDEQQRAHLALHLDQANYNGWRDDGTLHFRILTQILVQRRMGFTNLHRPNRTEIVGPRGAEDLENDGTRAALTEGHVRLTGTAPAVELDEDATLILTYLYRYSAERNRTELDYAWVLHTPQDLSTQEVQAVHWIRDQLGRRVGDRLSELVGSWGDVCLRVCRVLEQFTGF